MSGSLVQGISTVLSNAILNSNTKINAMPATAFEFGLASNASENTYQELIASCAAVVKWVVFTLWMGEGSLAKIEDIFLATGAGGAEVAFYEGRVKNEAATAEGNVQVLCVPIGPVSFAAGTRFAWKFDETTGTQGVTTQAAVTLGE